MKPYLSKVQKGFTMIEIIMVVVTIGIMAAFTIPKMTQPNEFIIAGEAKSVLASILGAQQRFALDNGGSFATNIDSLDMTLPASTNFDSLAVFNDAAGLASCSRIGGAYSLIISSTGVITCVGGDACINIHCNKNGIQQCN